MPVLLPSEQTTSALKALRKFIEVGAIIMYELCDCGGQIRHYNGGNYHEITRVKADGGKWWVAKGSTSDYDNATWQEVTFTEALKMIEDRAARGYSF